MARNSEVNEYKGGVIFFGHLNCGKSTILGHLLTENGSVPHTIIESYAAEGAGASKYAWLFDRLQEEREKGMSMELTLRPIVLQSIGMDLIDSPGHPDYLDNLLAGLSLADCGVLVVSAAEGEFEDGFSNEGQTKEYIKLVNTMGVRKLIVVVNKMDLTQPPFSQTRYDQIKSDVCDFFKLTGYRPDAVPFIPISGWLGDNLMEVSSNMRWFSGWSYIQNRSVERTGKTFNQALESISSLERTIDTRLRIPVEKCTKIEGIGTVMVGKVVAGKIMAGDSLVFAPTNTTAKVFYVEKQNEVAREGEPRDIVQLKLTDISGPAIEKGHVAGSVDPPKEAEEFTALVRVEDGEITAGYQATVNCHTCKFTCLFAQLIEKQDRMGRTLENNPISLKAGESGLVKMVPQTAVCVESLTDFTLLSFFVVREGAKVVGMGYVKEVKKKV